jgi:hypothetical protein
MEMMMPTDFKPSGESVIPISKTSCEILDTSLSPATKVEIGEKLWSHLQALNLGRWDGCSAASESTYLRRTQ